jgi:hypothetical protein
MWPGGQLTADRRTERRTSTDQFTVMGSLRANWAMTASKLPPPSVTIW